LGPRAGLNGMENLICTGIPSPDRPARRESLYQLRYPGRHASLCITGLKTVGKRLYKMKCKWRNQLGKLQSFEEEGEEALQIGTLCCVEYMGVELGLWSLKLSCCLTLLAAYNFTFSAFSF
jgi:hypothetical protein